MCPRGVMVKAMDSVIEVSEFELRVALFTFHLGDARGVTLIFVGNGHGDTNSNPRWDWLHFTEH